MSEELEVSGVISYGPQEINSEVFLISSSLIFPACSHLVACLNVLGFPGLAPIFIHCTGYWFGKVGISRRCWALSNAPPPIVPSPILAGVGESESGDFHLQNQKTGQAVWLGGTVLWTAGRKPPCLVA